MKRIFSLLILLVVFELSFAQSRQLLFPPMVLNIGYPQYIRACDIPHYKYNREELYTRFLYKGYKTILHDPDKKSMLNMELKFADSTKIPKSFFADMEKVRRKNAKKYLLIDVVGNYTNGTATDSGLNRATFTVERVIALQRILRRAPRFQQTRYRKALESYTDYQAYPLDRPFERPLSEY